MTQEVQLFHGTLRDNVTLFDSSVSDARLRAVFSELDLEAWLDSLPSGLDRRDDQSVSGRSRQHRRRTRALCDLIGRTFFAIVAVVVIWRTNPLLTLVVCAPLLLMAWVIEALGTRTMAYRAASRAATSGVTVFLGELLVAHLALTVAGGVNNAVARLDELGEGRRRLAVRDSVFDVLQDSFSINLGNFAAGVVLLMGAQLVGDGGFAVGDFALFVVYLDVLVWYPAEIGRLLSDLKRIRVSYRRMRGLAPSERAEGLVARTLPAAPIIEAQRLERLDVRGLSFVYPNGGGGVCGVSFTLERGAFTVITRVSALGNLRCSRCCLDYCHATRARSSGTASRWRNRRRSSFHREARTRRRCRRLISASLRDNILLRRDASDAVLDRAVCAAVLERDVSGLELGLDTIVGPRGMKLSGGQMQRAAATRMFVGGAVLLVLDDLSSALDADTEAELWSRLFARRGEVTCLVVSHRPVALRRADQVLEFDGGRLAT